LGFYAGFKEGGFGDRYGSALDCRRRKRSLITMSGYSLNIGPSPADLDEESVKSRYSREDEGDYEGEVGVIEPYPPALQRLFSALNALRKDEYNQVLQREVYEARKALGED
jgi:hypothetical protein